MNEDVYLNNLKILDHSDFKNVRTIMEESGEMLFCGSDVAKALQYAKPQNAIRAHCKGAVTKWGIGVQTGIKKDGTPAYQIVDKLFITEPDLYRLITNSKLPAAKKFESLIFDEILPSIRENRCYIIDDNFDNLDDLLDFVIDARSNHEKSES